MLGHGIVRSVGLRLGVVPHGELRKQSIDLKQSFGFGDTEQDTAILEKVGYPIALNPNENLLKICEERGWRHFYKDDDVVAEIKKISK